MRQRFDSTTFKYFSSLMSYLPVEYAKQAHTSPQISLLYPGKKKRAQQI